MDIVLSYIKLGSAWSVISVVFLSVNVLSYVIPPLASALKQKVFALIRVLVQMSSTAMPEENSGTVFSWPMYKSMLSVTYYMFLKAAKIGKAFPDFIVYRVEENLEEQTTPPAPIKISQLQRPNKPLVLLFGSYTCVVFWNKLAEIEAIVKEFEDAVDFAFIYVKEAHPVDGWYMTSNKLEVKTHTTLKERMNTARLIFSKVKTIPVYVDNMTDDACLAYAAYPSRFVALTDGKMEFFATGYTPMAFKPMLLKTWLRKHVKKTIC